MAIFEWDDSIALGIDTIDEQHKALFTWINTLSIAVNSGDGTEAVNEIIWKLITYVTEHFGEEERLMLSWNYPQIDEHRKEHDLFVEKLREIQVEFIGGHEMSENVLDFMTQWLVFHIKGTDQRYKQFYNNYAAKHLTA